MPNGGFRQVEDLELTRYACYILFQNADGSKVEIAALQQYFKLSDPTRGVDHFRELTNMLQRTSS